MVSFVKAPSSLIEESVSRRAALCVNRRGQFALKDSGYTVMSHVWGETMGWQTPQAWGPVDLSLRKRGIPRAHFLRFFDRCDAEWLWVDVIAMPEVLEDMTASQKAETEAVRVGMINSLRSIYRKADKLVVLDTLLLRLHTRSLVDVAVVLSMSFWMTRLWTFVETRLAKKVMLKTRDFAFDLDTVVDFFGRNVINDEHRYFALIQRLSPLRKEILIGFPVSTIVENAYYGCESRYTDVPLDQVRVLFPLLGLDWEPHWTLQQGLAEILRVFPEEAVWLQKWCSYRSIEYDMPNSDILGR